VARCYGRASSPFARVGSRASLPTGGPLCPPPESPHPATAGGRPAGAAGPLWMVTPVPLRREARRASSTATRGRPRASTRAALRTPWLDRGSHRPIARGAPSVCPRAFEKAWLDHSRQLARLLFLLLELGALAWRRPAAGEPEERGCRRSTALGAVAALSIERARFERARLPPNAPGQLARATSQGLRVCGSSHQGFVPHLPFPSATRVPRSAQKDTTWGGIGAAAAGHRHNSLMRKVLRKGLLFLSALEARPPAVEGYRGEVSTNRTL